ncbi:hypothetical protein KXS07_27120 [Inquilinus limosus]|uniref:hypothetical protein n=1 Tax=Inquilinus limosus TaxID=171674 RepID=UPI003F14F74C
MSLTLALRSLFRAAGRERATEAVRTEKCLAPFSPVRLGDWLALAAAAGVAAVPALRLGDIAAFDLASLAGDSEDPVSADGHAAVQRLTAALRDAPAASVLRWDIGCLEITRAAAKAGRRPEGAERGYSVFRGRVHPCFRDARLARQAILWPQPRVAAWLRPWIEPRKIAGDTRPHPEAWRIFLGADGIIAASLVHPEAPVAPEWLAGSGCGPALAAARRLFDRMRAEHVLRRLQGDPARPDGILFTLDFLIDETGRALLLDGAPAPADDRTRPSWRCCFRPEAGLAGIAVGDGRVLTLPQPDEGSAAAA